jgi:iron only hydrogenase large subunit-like protein
MMTIIITVMPKGIQKYFAESMTSLTSTIFLLSLMPCRNRRERGCT